MAFLLLNVGVRNRGRGTNFFEGVRNCIKCYVSRQIRLQSLIQSQGFFLVLGKNGGKNLGKNVRDIAQ